jgi:hypothetical protein
VRRARKADNIRRPVCLPEVFDSDVCLLLAVQGVVPVPVPVQGPDDGTCRHVATAVHCWQMNVRQGLPLLSCALPTQPPSCLPVCQT